MVTTRVLTRSAPAPAPIRAEASGWWYIGGVLMFAAMLIYTVAWATGDPTERGLIIGPLMVALSMPFILRLRATETRFDLAGIVFAGLGLKLCAAYGRLYMVEHIFGGTGDSYEYSFYGSRFAPMIRNFDFGIDAGRPVPGTGFIRVLTAVVYAVFRVDFFTGFIVFGMLAFIGCWFFYKAFAMAVPNGDLKRYAILIFFWPSLVFWPSAIGKEAWMIFSLGIASAGAAAAFSRRPYGYPLLGLGILAAAMPRPHIAIVVLAAAGIGLVMATLFGAGAGGRKATFLTKAIGILFLVVAAAVLVPRVAKFLDIDEVGTTGLNETLDEVEEQTTQGGSSYAAPAISSPIDYPWAFVTVLFRPFVYEVDGTASAISSIEGMMLAALMLASAHRIARLPLLAARNAYITYATAFAFMFVYVFSFVGNFGILARQRVQLLPFLLVLMALPIGSRGSDEPDAATGSVPLAGRAQINQRAARLTVAPPRSR